MYLKAFNLFFCLVLFNFLLTTYPFHRKTTSSCSHPELQSRSTTRRTTIKSRQYSAASRHERVLGSSSTPIGPHLIPPHLSGLFDWFSLRARRRKADRTRRLRPCGNAIRGDRSSRSILRVVFLVRSNQNAAFPSVRAKYGFHDIISALQPGALDRE